MITGGVSHETETLRAAEADCTIYARTVSGQEPAPAACLGTEADRRRLGSAATDSQIMSQGGSVGAGQGRT